MYIYSEYFLYTLLVETFPTRFWCFDLFRGRTDQKNSLLLQQKLNCINCLMVCKEFFLLRIPPIFRKISAEEEKLVIPKRYALQENAIRETSMCEHLIAEVIWHKNCRKVSNLAYLLYRFDNSNLLVSVSRVTKFGK